MKYFSRKLTSKPGDRVTGLIVTDKIIDELKLGKGLTGSRLRRILNSFRLGIVYVPIKKLPLRRQATQVLQETLKEREQGMSKSDYNLG